jgi:hypothetical protein
MDVNAVREIMDKEPFVPLRLVKTDGRTLDIPFKHVLLPMKGSAIVFKGIESETSRFAKDGYEHVSYEAIARLEPRARGRGGAGGGKKSGKDRRGKGPK